jgi:hypothetical protein
LLHALLTASSLAPSFLAKSTVTKMTTIQLHLWLLYPGERTSGTHYIQCWIRSRPYLNTLKGLMRIIQSASPYPNHYTNGEISPPHKIHGKLPQCTINAVYIVFQKPIWSSY